MNDSLSQRPPEQGGIQILPIPGIPLVQPGDDLAALIIEAAEAAGLSLIAGDILVMAQKIVSKAEGRLVRLADVTPGEEAVRLAQETGKDARVVQAVLDDSRAVVRARAGVLIVEQSSGWVCAHGGLDHSNVAPEEEETVALLPADADASATAIRGRIEAENRRNCGRSDQRQPRAPVEDGDGWRLYRLCGSAGALGPAGADRPVRLRTGRQRRVHRR